LTVDAARKVREACRVRQLGDGQPEARRAEIHMRETPKQYTKRILSYVQGQAPLRVQQATVGKIERLVRPLSRRQMRKRPAPGKWSIAEILAHLAETELVGGYRIRMILGVNGTPIQAFDQNVWARNSNYARQDPRKSLRMFRVLREANLALLKSLPRRKWSLYGIHAERGKETVARVAQMFAGHDINHLRQIQRLASEIRRVR
jgi:DinB superfamily